MRCDYGERLVLQREMGHAAGRLAAGGNRSRGQERFLHAHLRMVRFMKPG
jgi:hypothetical protein